MWIEVVGLPGVGKTTMVEKHISTISKDYEVIKSDRSTLVQKIITKFLWLYYSLRLGDKNLAKKLAYRSGFRAFLDRDDNVFFYDSGIMQVFLENLIETDFADSAKKLDFMKHLSLPGGVIYIKDDIEETAKREVQRPKTRFNLGFAETLVRYRKAEIMIEKELLRPVTILDTISSHNDEKFIEVVTREKVF